jgi:glutathionyl-hydroquinone reductase
MALRGRYTEADLRLFPTLARFDVAYHYAFKCNIRRLVDYPRLWDYARRIYHRPGHGGHGGFDIYKQGYFSPSELAQSARDRAGGSRDRLEVEQRRSGRGLRPVGA